MLKKSLNKFLSLYVLLKHGRLDVHVRYFYRDTYYCKLVQLLYFFKDYLFKRKYKTISFQGEFAPELQFALPFAYWHHKNGTLKSTRSSKHTSELYFFSPDHQEVFEKRTPEANYNYEVPRILYSHDYDMSKWAAVPLKEHFKNDIFIFKKPTVVVANRYNMEWDGPPISFLGLPLLNSIFAKLKKEFTIVYNRPRAANIAEDNSKIYDLEEYDWIRETHPEVILMEDLYASNQGNAQNFNHLQLMVYANSEHFISVHGGTAALASYFRGINIILSKKGPEHHFNCYQKLYPKLSGATIFHVKTDEQLMRYIDKYFIK